MIQAEMASFGRGLMNGFQRKTVAPGVWGVVGSSWFPTHSQRTRMDGAQSLFLLPSPSVPVPIPCSLFLVDRSGGEAVALRFEVEGAEGMFVLGQVLPQHIPQGFGLLRAEIDGVLIADGDLVGALAGGQTEDQLEVPDADADLDAVGVGLAVVGGLDEVHLRLLRGWTHGVSRLLQCPEAGETLYN